MKTYDLESPRPHPILEELTGEDQAAVLRTINEALGFDVEFHGSAAGCYSHDFSITLDANELQDFLARWKSRKDDLCVVPSALLSRAAAVDYWAMTTNSSSNAAHAYKNGKAICGSPLQASRQRWETPGCIGCKKCRKIWDALPSDSSEVNQQHKEP